MGANELISEESGEKLISETLYSLDWLQFSSLRLEKDEENWIEVCGNTEEDGMAIFYTENGTEYLSDDIPRTIHQIEELLIHFYRGYKSFRSLGFSLFTDDVSKEESNTNYELWKLQYNAKEKIEKRKST